MKRGEGLEQYIIDRCRADGFLLLAKTDPPVRVLRWLPGNQFKGTFLQEGFLDITGPVQGHHVEIEVKDCKGMRWPLSKLRDHQYTRMQHLQQDKALSGLALRLRGANANHDFVYLVPSVEVVKLKEQGKKSILLADLQLLESEGAVVRHEYNRVGDVDKFLTLVLTTL